MKGIFINQLQTISFSGSCLPGKSLTAVILTFKEKSYFLRSDWHYKFYFIKRWKSLQKLIYSGKTASATSSPHVIFFSLPKYKCPFHSDPCSVPVSHMNYIPAISHYLKQLLDFRQFLHKQLFLTFTILTWKCISISVIFPFAPNLAVHRCLSRCACFLLKALG